MIRNEVKRKLARGEPTVGNWISLPSPSVVEILARIAMDWLVLDTEHGPFGEEQLENMMRAVRGTSVAPIVRVPDTDPALIKKALDRGGYDIVCPLVNTAEQAELAVAACKYPPEGIRGVAGTRASGYGADLAEYYRTCNEEILVACQIETATALENVREIAAVAGVDVLFIGPSDLSANLGLFGETDGASFREAVDRIRSAARDHKVAVGYYALNADEARLRIDQGMDFVSVANDVSFLAGAAEAAYSHIRGGL